MTAKLSVLHDYEMGKSFSLNRQAVGLTSFFRGWVDNNRSEE